MELMKLNIQKFSDGGDSGSADGFTFKSATQGISDSGIRHMKSELTRWELWELLPAINDDLRFVGSLRDNWEGDDRVVYVKNLHAAQKKVCDKIDECVKAINKEFDSMAESWHAFEKSNVKGK